MLLAEKLGVKNVVVERQNIVSPAMVQIINHLDHFPDGEARELPSAVSEADGR